MIIQETEQRHALQDALYSYFLVSAFLINIISIKTLIQNVFSLLKTNHM